MSLIGRQRAFLERKLVESVVREKIVFHGWMGGYILKSDKECYERSFGR